MYKLLHRGLCALLIVFDINFSIWKVNTLVPGKNCGILVPFRTIGRGEKYTGPFLPCMLIEDPELQGQYERTVSYWDEFQPWSECTKTCGGGTKSRSRSCFKDKELVDPNECFGSTVQTWNCNTQLCTIPQPWGQWSDCSVTCGSGVQTRIRKCLDTIANINVPYIHCKNSNETSTQACGGGIPCNGWTTWSEWSVCPYTVAGAQRNKSRKCMNGDEGQVNPSYCGGTATDASQQEPCPALKPCPDDHPHAFQAGLACCKFFYRSNVSSLCDGQFLQLADPLECCVDSETVDCANEPGYCQDNPIAPTFCPTNPGQDKSLGFTPFSLRMICFGIHFSGAEY